MAQLGARLNGIQKATGSNPVSSTIRLAAAYTAHRRPVMLVCSEEHSDQPAAVRRERQLKGWGHQKYAALVRADMARIHEVSKRRR